MTNPAQDFWNDMYESGEYREHWDCSYPSQELVSYIAAHPPAADAVALDVGCGAGREAVFLAQAGFRTIGSDISPKALEIGSQRAAEAGVEVDFRHSDALALPIDDVSVDFINDRGVFHIVRPEDQPQFAAELTRVLKPEGVILLRGASEEETEEHFTPITEAAIERSFPSTRFTRGPLLPIKLVSDAEGTLDARIVILKKL